MESKGSVFTRPKRLEVEENSLTESYGKFTADPFERGFGTTIGNSLRRILLSSISGAAITSIRIEGVEHEFSTLTGMKEDIAELILSLKQLKLSLHGDQERTIRIDKSGPGKVSARGCRDRSARGGPQPFPAPGHPQYRRQTEDGDDRQERQGLLSGREEQE